MFPKTSPETSGAIQARLADLRNRKAALDEAVKRGNELLRKFEAANK